MNTNSLLNNDVNRAGANDGEGPSSGRCPMAQQHGPGRHPATAARIRRKWTQYENRVVMECFYLSDRAVATLGVQGVRHPPWPYLSRQIKRKLHSVGKLRKFLKSAR